MSAFEQLHGAVQHHIVNSLGWRQLRALQEQSIAPLLAGNNAICIAPTAGGKTEAALFPLLSQMLTEDWQGLSIIYVCPIKALLNNLFERLEYYGGLFGRRVGLWHGDISAADKNRWLKQPPDILLTTPESLEALLISTRSDAAVLFADLQAIVVDELHAFAGSDRGWQLLFLIERLARLAQHDLQRVGLSATVGNPAALLDWLTGSSQRPRSVVNIPANALDKDVQLDYVGSLSNAALVISRLHRGEKRLVFCDSRRQTEDLTYELRLRGVNTFVSHSSLSVETRCQAEQAFAAGSNCVIVATSTLELGIDVGDLDRVIQIDAPYTVASFLQRLGRTGRRADTVRNCLFLATTHDSFLRAGGLLTLWRQGYVEPVEPPPMPVQVIAQQIMTLCLQYGQLTRSDIGDFFAAIPALNQSISAQQIDILFDGMLAQGFLHAEQGLFSIGPKAEKIFGKRNYMELLSVFETQAEYQVMWGRQILGVIQPRVLHTDAKQPLIITLAGRNWQMLYRDEKQRRVQVEPTEIKGRSRWFGHGQAAGFALCQALRDFILQQQPADFLSNRGIEHLQELQEDFDWLSADASVLMELDNNVWQWWTFAGMKANAELALNMGTSDNRATANPCWVRFRFSGSYPALVKSLQALLDRLLAGRHQLPPDENEGKFSACIPELLNHLQARHREVDEDALRALRSLAIVRAKVNLP